ITPLRWTSYLGTTRCAPGRDRIRGSIHASVWCATAKQDNVAGRAVLLLSPLRGKERVDTPHGLKPDGFSVLWGGLRHLSLKALPKPLYILGGVVVSMQA